MRRMCQIGFAFLFFGVVTACSGVEQSAIANDAGLVTSPKTQSGSAIAPWDSTGCGDDDYRNVQMERHPALMGMTPEALEVAYETPATRQDFRVGEPVGTFYGALGNNGSGPPHRDAGAQARVLTWEKSDCNFSIFFVAREGRLVAVDAFEWSPGTDF